MLTAAQAGAQTPWVAAISPASVTAGSGAFTLTVIGTGFAPLARVVWNQTSLTSSATSSSRMIAAVPASLVATSGVATIAVVNPDGATSAATQIAIALPMTVLTSPALPSATQGRLYSQAIAVAGGSPPYRFTLASGVLPIGVSLDGNTGAVVGPPSSEGNYEFTIQVSDAAQTMLSRTFTLGVFRELAIVTTALPRAIAGVAYLFSLLASGGSIPYSNWQVASGSLPAGISLSNGGSLSGAATAAGSSQFTVRLRDGAGLTATRILTLEVSAALSMPAAPALPPLTVGAPFSHRLTPVGGTVPFLFSIAEGELPPGIRLDAGEGKLVGAASTAGLWRATIQVIDAAGQRAATTLAFTAIDSLALSTESVLPAGVAGVAYAQPLAAAGGSQPYRFALVSGVLPTGMALDAASGRISGTPSQPGALHFTIAVTDAAGRAASRAFTLTVSLPTAPRLAILAAASVPPATQSRVSLTLDAPYPVELTGTLELTMSQLPDDPAVRFSNGRRTATYRFPPGETTAQFDAAPLALQSGTISGALSLQATLEAAGRPLLAQPVRHTLYVQTSAPMVREARLMPVAGGFEIAITGFSPSREMAQAVFRFLPAAGEDLDTRELTLPLATLAGQWFDSPGSAPYGSQFTYRQTFQFTGLMSAVGTVSVTLVNTIGDSEAVIAVPSHDHREWMS